MKKEKKINLKSLNIKEEQNKKLKQLFPEVFSGEKVDFDKLKLSLGENIDVGRERYGMNWPGKAQAIKVAQLPSDATLKPDKKASVDFYTTQNLFIEGDNLEVLKLLQKSYFGKIKMIYLDPPYNTGKEFIYPDNYEEGLNTYLQYTGQIDAGGKKFSTNVEADGRFHSKWMNMMWPRLFLARNLLTEDGIIFISIDDHEVDNLRKICDEIFGEENFIENYIWESTFRPDNSSGTKRENGQYVTCFSKNINLIKQLNGQNKNREGLPSLTKNSMGVSKLTFPAKAVKTFLKDGFYNPEKTKAGYELHNKIKVKDGLIINSFSLSGRVIWSQSYLNAQLESGTEIIIKTSDFVPYSSKKTDSQLAPTTLIPNDIVGDVLEARAEVSQLFTKTIFDYPKPVSLIKYLTNYIDSKDFIILDFFVGSGTTAHAVMDLNAEDGGNRKFIVTQLQEKTEKDSEACKAGYKDIAKIGEERIRRAGRKILEENKSKDGFNAEKFDKGFKVFKLDKSNFAIWNGDTKGNLQKKLELHINNTDPKSTEDDILYEILAKAGFELTEKVEEVKIEGKKVYSISNGELLICLDKKIDKDFVRSLAEKKPKQFICLNSSFKEDADLTNTAKILENNQIEFRTI